MKLSVSNESIEYILDTLGNLYLKHGETIYDIVICADDTLCVEEFPSELMIDLTEVEVQNYKKKLIMLSDPSSLTDQIEISQVIDEATKKEEGCEKYYYENHIYDEGDIYNDDGEEAVEFMYADEKKKNIKIIEFGESVALYDVIVHNVDLDSRDIVMKTKLLNQIPIYRINICPLNRLSFRAIGCEEYIYNIDIDENNKLKLVKVTV